MTKNKNTNLVWSDSCRRYILNDKASGLQGYYLVIWPLSLLVVLFMVLMMFIYFPAN